MTKGKKKSLGKTKNILHEMSSLVLAFNLNFNDEILLYSIL